MQPQISDATRSALAAVVPFSSLGKANEAEPFSPKMAKDDRAEVEGGHEEAESREGGLRLTAEQISAARIQVAKTSGGGLVRHLTVPGTIVPAADRHLVLTRRFQRSNVSIPAMKPTSSAWRCMPDF